MDNVKHKLQAPIICDVCCSPDVNFVTNDKVYGRIYGEWPYCYFCSDCRAAVGCHPNTEIPLGKMAGKETRQLRKKAHEAFDKLWQTRLMSRDRAYFWLSRILQIEPENCHISWLTDAELKLTIDNSNSYYEENLKALIRRKEKEEVKQNARTREFVKSTNPKSNYKKQSPGLRRARSRKANIKTNS